MQREATRLDLTQFDPLRRLSLRTPAAPIWSGEEEEEVEGRGGERRGGERRKGNAGGTARERTGGEWATDDPNTHSQAEKRRGGRVRPLELRRQELFRMQAQDHGSADQTQERGKSAAGKLGRRPRHGEGQGHSQSRCEDASGKHEKGKKQHLENTRLDCRLRVLCELVTITSRLA